MRRFFSAHDDLNASGGPALPYAATGLADRRTASRRLIAGSALALTLLSTIASADIDGDGVADSADNCTQVANPIQCDSDGDGFGNHCDGDLNNNGSTNAQDTVLYRAQLGQPSVGPTYNLADLNCNGNVNAQDSVLFRNLLGNPPGPSGVGPPGGGPIVPLFDASTVLEPAIVVDTGTALVTRFGDRARDRHAREAQFRAYDHYLSWYWEQRTVTIEIIDRIAKGGTSIEFNVYPQWQLSSSSDFRAFFRGITTQGEYHTNLPPNPVVGSNPLRYTYTLTINPKASPPRPIAIGDRLEIEVSQFLQSPTNGRSNYYGTAVLYIVGQGGVVPWEGQGAQLDSFPLPVTAWMGGLTTLPYQYSNEPLERFKQMPGLTAAISSQPFMLGRRLHHTDFGTGAHSEFPTQNPIYTEQVGKLGPQFYASRCVDCHVNNGRAIPPGLNTTIFNAVTKVGTATGAADPQLGSSLQPFRTGGAGEGSISISSYTFVDGTYGDGTAYQLRKPNYTFVGPVPSNYSVRNTMPLVGLGLLEAVPEDAITAMADPGDSNGDGISGRAQTLTDPETGQTRLGRFGWKAGAARLSHQVASALNADMGVTTAIFPQPDCGTAQTGCGSAGAELNAADLNNLVRYVALLGVAARRNLSDAEALQGETLFSSAGCAGCHTPTLPTSAQHPFAELRSQTIRPYTNLLLHDMGPDLADNLGEGNASGAEWRTPPLWSIGLTAGVSGGQEAYLHDGRARNLSEAILWHGGEAAAAKEAFRTMTSTQRAALLKFVQSL